MARPTKNNCEFFSHDAGMRNHRKVKAIRNKFTNGYAIWCMLLEYLTGIDGNEFEQSDIEFELMAGDFGFDKSEIKEVVEYCLNLEMLFLKNDFIFSESLNERLAPVYEKRNKAKELSAKQRRKNGKYVTETPQQPVVSVTEMPQSKVKESRVEETKEKKSRVNKVGEQSSLFLDIKNCFLEWYLLEKNSAYYFTGKDGKAINELIKQIQFAGAQKNEGKPPGWELAAFKWLLKNLPKWVYQNCSLTNISSKFNEIKDGHTASKQQNGNAGLSAEYLADLERRCRPEESV